MSKTAVSEVNTPSGAAATGALPVRDWGPALVELRARFQQSPTLAVARDVLDRLKGLEGLPPGKPCRVAVLRSFTIEPSFALLKPLAALHGVDLSARFGEFNAYAQEILDGNSPLYRDPADVALLAVQTRDLVPELWDRSADLSPEAAKAVAERASKTLESLVHTFRSRTRAALLIHNLEEPARPAAGVLAAQGDDAQVESIREINAALRRVAREVPGVYLIDYDGLVARHGRARWHDRLKWLTMRMPVAADALFPLAKEHLRYLLPLAGKVCKVAVVDLDNTLWGGVVGEDGPEGIKVGPEHPGASFLALQRALLDLRQRGVLLAVCSKNNPDDAMRVLANHPEMLLRPQHFSAIRVNWADKAENLREIAAELNVGLDALAFLDDNPTERLRVSQELPEVFLVDLPADPGGYAEAVRDCPVFERLALSDEDRSRGRYYEEQKVRDEQLRASGSLEDFYRSLGMELEFAVDRPETVARVAQLTQKTNQFNLTTRRYGEAEVDAMLRSDDWGVHALRVRDRFGDNGLVAVALLRHDGDGCEIDTFLMSCRVIGRTVETALLAHVADAARASGLRVLRGSYLPTAKNAPCRDFYAGHGFRPVGADGEGTRWELDLETQDVRRPEWFRVPAGGESGA